MGSILLTDIYVAYQVSLTVLDGLETSTQQITVDVAPARYGNHSWSLTQ